ncbi:efflux RND transporter periplasmic adaptor subunit [Cohnella lupini]|uniref:Multidrug efflux pump subunit AcrA (Membrane-fusion protein) n=1 Tax=Cohnella lupini TaxID=1294267 RepID=A0A3D9IBX1_9BACL|nr:HlyD family efflux transporter periplasmic adaptor subunit [Cohnella lupini]RED59274.1 multidrug efflux pump subunit AcrA (membrane-fusion protein) [Cohnella lupini]
MELDKVNQDRRRNRILLAIMIGFVGLLVFFTLFSNTLMSMNLPKAITEQPNSGSLVVALEGSGTLQPITETQLSNPAGWKVLKIRVKEGDRVEKGQALILYDGSSVELEMANEMTALEKQKIELQNLQDQFIQSVQEEDELKIRNAKRAIETFMLDLGTQERTINELRNRMNDQREITSPFDGIITEINAVEGQISSGEPDIRMVNGNQGYRLEIAADSTLVSGLGLAAGEKIDIDVQRELDRQSRVIQGKIEEVTNAEPRSESSYGVQSDQTLTIPRKTLRIKVVDSELKGGEQAEIKLEKRSSKEGLVVSSEAVHYDRDGMYVFKIETLRGALGNVFVARKVRIQFSETNDNKTMIQTDNLFEEDLIILESSEPLQDGERVRLQ